LCAAQKNQGQFYQKHLQFRFYHRICVKQSKTQTDRETTAEYSAFRFYDNMEEDLAVNAAPDKQQEMEMGEDKPQGRVFQPGRPRSEKSRKAILDATRRLLTHMPLSELSIEAIAKKAKVGKTTIYRWWPNKASIAMEAFLEQPGVQNIVPTTATSSDAVVKQLESLIRQLRGQNGRIIAGIIAESQSNADVLDLLYDKFLKERISPLYEHLEKGMANGEFRKDLNTEIALDMLVGPLFMRVLSGEHGIDNNFAENYPRQALNALSA
jgi:AcrR family transcriptional regulator